MKIIAENVSLSDFNFWAGANTNAAYLTSEELDMVGDMLEDVYPEGLTETQINDIMWFDFAWVCEMLGIEWDEEQDYIKR